VTGAAVAPGHRPLLAAILADVAAAQVIVLQPAYVQGLVDHAGMSDAKAGYALSAEMLAFAVATISMAAIASRVRWRPLVQSALLVLLLCHLASAWMVHTSMFVAIRVAAGLAAGIVVPLAFASIGLTSKPERGYGLVITSVLLYGAILLTVTPALFRAGGVAALLVAMASTCVVALAASFAFHEPSRHATAQPRKPHRTSATERAALSAMFFYFMAQGSFWAYASLIGKSKGLSDGVVSDALALSQFAGIAGALLPAVLADRAGRTAPLAAGILCGVLPLAALAGPVTAVTFTVVVAIYQFGWNLSHPFLLGMFARFDRTGQVVVYGTAMQKLGLAAGPAAAAVVVAYASYGIVVAMSMALCALSLILVMPAIRAQSNSWL